MNNAKDTWKRHNLSGFFFLERQKIFKLTADFAQQELSIKNAFS